MLAILTALTAAQGGFTGGEGLRAVAAPLPAPDGGTLSEVPLVAPDERPDTWVNEAPEPFLGQNPNWVYVEDPAKDEPVQPLNLLQNWTGIVSTGWYPPDVQMAVGNTYVGEVVNSDLYFFNKSGVVQYSATLFSFFSPLSPPTNYIFDPKIAYDPISDRWLVMALYRRSSTTTSDYYLAVSQSSNPLGSWYYYALDATLDGTTPSANWADYPGMGFNDWGIFFTSNQFGWSGGYAYAKLRVMDKAAAYGGTLSGWYDFWAVGAESNWKPAQTLVSCQTEFVARSYWGSSSWVRAWKVTGPASSPTLSSRYDIAVNSYTWPSDAVQLGGGQQIDTGDDRTQDVTFTSTPNNEGVIYFTFTEDNPTASGWAAARFIRIDTTSMTAVQDISFGASGFDYYYPRVAPSDSCLGMGMTRSSSSEYANARYTYKLYSDAAWQASVLIKAGESYYDRVFSGRNRWGDYLGAYIDPSDNKTIWVASEYARSGNTWGTWIAELNCGSLGAQEQGPKEPSLKLPSGRIFAGSAVLRLEGAGDVGVFSSDGRLVRSLVGPGEFRLSLAPGVYILRSDAQAGSFIVVQ